LKALKSLKEMNNLFWAIQFLTIIPVSPRFHEKEKQLSSSVIYFPLVGLLLGLVLVALNIIISQIFISQILISAILVITLAILTGALHLDGLADTFDALGSRKNKEGFLEVLRDPQVGTMGALSLVCVILLKILILSTLSSQARNLALILMCVLSRWSIMLPIYSFPYARKIGKAEEFFAGFKLMVFIPVTLLVLIFTILILSWKGLFIFTTVLLFTFLFNKFINKKIDGITGDILGATLELNEVIILICMAAIFGV